MKHVQEENNKKRRFFLYKSHSGLEALSICGIRLRRVKRGKHNCVDKYGNPVSYEVLSFGSIKAAIRYVKTHFDTINGEGRYLLPVRCIAIQEENHGRAVGKAKIVWFSEELAYDSKYRKLCHTEMYKKRIKDKFYHKYAEGCFVRKPTLDLLKALDDMGRWFERPWVPKNLEESTLIASVNGGYWLTDCIVESNEYLLDCEDNHKKFLKRARLLNTVEYRLKKSMKKYREQSSKH